MLPYAGTNRIRFKGYLSARVKSRAPLAVIAIATIYNKLSFLATAHYISV